MGSQGTVWPNGEWCSHGFVGLNSWWNNHKLVQPDGCGFSHRFAQPDGCWYSPGLCGLTVVGITTGCMAQWLLVESQIYTAQWLLYVQVCVA